ncbi:unannotated protein [freshwater metagenome]|uniref:Unannotated protein n=1 Tax=freshwater metagenome TaxID=449393 RepID=A0A6J7VT72_9ZZZZ
MLYPTIATKVAPEKKVPVPFVFVAVTLILSLKPTSSEVTTYVNAFAPTISV